MADKLYHIGGQMVSKADYARVSAAYSAKMRAMPAHMKGVNSIGKQAAPPSKGHNNRPSKPLIADTSGSTCFESLAYQGGVVTATFLKDGTTYDYEMSKADAREWFQEPSLGNFFNLFVR